MNKRQKKKQLKMRNKKLVEKYPFLLPRNVWSGEVPKDYKYEYTRYESIPNGWRKAFGQLLIDELREALVETNYLDKFMFLDIKEKYGELCLYCNGAPREVHDILHKYEFISGYVCICCGSIHATIVDDYGWFLPVCKDCWEKSNKKRKKKGYGIMTYNKAAGKDEDFNEELNIPKTYTVTTYMKGKDYDTTYDISNIVNQIENNYKKRVQKRKC